MIIVSVLLFVFIMLVFVVGLWCVLVIEGYWNNSLKVNMFNRNYGCLISLKGRLVVMVDYLSWNEVYEFIDKIVIVVMKDV